MKIQDFDIFRQKIYNTIRFKGEKRQAEANGEKIPKKSHPSLKRTFSSVKKIDFLTSKKTPPTQTELSKKFNCSIRIITNIIHKDPGKYTRRKLKVNALKASDKQNRKANLKKLYKNHLAAGKLEFIVTLDKALFYL